MVHLPFWSFTAVCGYLEEIKTFGGIQTLNRLISYGFPFSVSKIEVLIFTPILFVGWVVFYLFVFVYCKIVPCFTIVLVHANIMISSYGPYLLSRIFGAFLSLLNKSNCMFI